MLTQLDNRAFLLGLDHLYREAMKRQESTRLLRCAGDVADRLGISEAGVPVEGYYTESPALTRYFRLMRALQTAPDSRRAAVDGLEAFRVLRELAGSGLFGLPADEDHSLLPLGRDPLTLALDRSTTWTIPHLVDAAFAIVDGSDDFSLVGLAAHTRDPLALAALRESTVLYASDGALGGPPTVEWAVDDALAARAARFVECFNRLMPEPLPDPVPANTYTFYAAFKEADVIGRCVCIGGGPHGDPPYYHWAIKLTAVVDFWSERKWTTAEFRAADCRVPGEDPEPEVRYKPPEWVTKAMCARCGTWIYFTEPRTAAQHCGASMVHLSSRPLPR